MRETVSSGLDDLPDLQWGSHLCQLYRDREELLETLVPFFRAGLRGNERCLWITADPLRAEEARSALLEVVEDLDAREHSGQIEILDHDDWYERFAGTTMDGVMAAWLVREAEALRCGYEGLRISGNTSFVAPEDWQRFAEYEERVQREFRDRRIVALCCYSLEQCHSDQILEALQSHDAAFVREDGSCEAVRNATELMARENGSRSSRRVRRPALGHAVQFHEREYDAESIAEHLADGLQAGGAALLIVTDEHRRAIEPALWAFSIDPEDAKRSGRLVALDAEELLSRICADGEPDGPLLGEQVGIVLSRLIDDFGCVHAYGEMVDLLAGEGRMEEAINLEHLWNELLAERPVRLLCGYHLSAFEHDGNSDSFRAVCDLHREVFLREPSTEQPLSQERLLAELRQRSRVARRAADQLSRLQSVTACLSELTSSPDISRAVGREVRRAVSADVALLALAGDDGESLGGFEPGRSPPREEPGLHRTAMEAFRSGKPQWRQWRPAERAEAAEADRYRTMACLPVDSPDRRLGALAFGWLRNREIRPAERALLQDVAGQVAVALDRARLYRDARAAREKAEQASRAKDEFLAMLGHELRNPLGPIVTTLELMRMRDANALDRERAVIERQVDHLLRLVEDLLDVSRITSGRIELTHARVEISEVVARAIDDVGPLLDQRRHRLIVDVPPKGLVVDGDAGRLAQVVANLLSNAAKFTPGTGTLEVSATSAEGEVVLRVLDDGVGISPELLPTVFESFVQGPVSRARSEGGLGLGLAIVRSLVELHDGSVSASSNGRGQGAEFVVRLPLAPPLEESQSVARATTFDALGQGLHVLVVDDNVDAAASLGELLDTMGCKTSLAHDGPSALLAAQEHEPALVLLDIGLPVMDGYEVATRLRDLEGVEDARIVAVTGYGQPGDRDRSKAAGFDDHLVKPLSPDHLRSLVAEVAGGSRPSLPPS
ncbi:MAG TPA: MEDS domain-containing protein [Thermoanaerobaculia bacterium]|nr:MEDS domain-containing protein [Thermoanaerobaculia bacterium]